MSDEVMERVAQVARSAAFHSAADVLESEIIESTPELLAVTIRHLAWKLRCRADDPWIEVKT